MPVMIDSLGGKRCCVATANRRNNGDKLLYNNHNRKSGEKVGKNVFLNSHLNKGDSLNLTNRSLLISEGCGGRWLRI